MLPPLQPCHWKWQCLLPETAWTLSSCRTHISPYSTGPSPNSCSEGRVPCPHETEPLPCLPRHIPPLPETLLPHCQSSSNCLRCSTGPALPHVPLLPNPFSTHSGPVDNHQAHLASSGLWSWAALAQRPSLTRSTRTADLAGTPVSLRCPMMEELCALLFLA